MTLLLIIVPVVWAFVITWAVGNLYFRPVGGLPGDDVELLKGFMAEVRKLAAAERRKAKRG